MSRLHLVGGEKGGVGKSVVARLLAQCWIDRGVHWTGFDTDRSHGALLRYYTDYSRPLEVDRMEDLDEIVEALADSNDEVLVDLAAQTESRLEEWIRSGDVIDLLNELGHELWYWYVIDDGKDSVNLLAALIERLGRSGHVVCVRNHGRGRDFTLFDQAKLRNRIEQIGGDVIDLPALHSATMLKIDAHDKSFWGAVHNSDPGEGPCLSLMERQRAKVFLRKVVGILDPLLDRQP